jgi:hypothetical protein
MQKAIKEIFAEDPADFILVAFAMGMVVGFGIAMMMKQY